MSERRPSAFRDLLAYQVSSTADSIRRSAAMRMRREHDLSLAQVRTLSLIDHLQPVRLRDVAADAGADKAQISRVVSSLVSRGYIARRALVGDARSAHLELTPVGRDKYAALFRTLQERDQVLKAGFQPAEIEQLLSLLARVRSTADRLTKDEEQVAVPGADEEAAA